MGAMTAVTVPIKPTVELGHDAENQGGTGTFRTGNSVSPFRSSVRSGARSRSPIGYAKTEYCQSATRPCTA